MEKQHVIHTYHSQFVFNLSGGGGLHISLWVLGLNSSDFNVLAFVATHERVAMGSEPVPKSRCPHYKKVFDIFSGNDYINNQPDPIPFEDEVFNSLVESSGSRKCLILFPD